MKMALMFVGVQTRTDIGRIFSSFDSEDPAGSQVGSEIRLLTATITTGTTAVTLQP